MNPTKLVILQTLHPMWFAIGFFMPLSSRQRFLVCRTFTSAGPPRGANLVVSSLSRDLRGPRLEEFLGGGGNNKLKVRLRFRNLAALSVLAKTRSSIMRRSQSALRPQADTTRGSDLSHDYGA